ncbi:hypothetical protein PHYBOEH_003160 [Phytophthora boehmeriae]|uniref:RxLR effector protein n=1 Tax=Phytophthora boehmeriae TaxID=109152 RepID=A0A8T1WVD7_9STRA|nr:hypothetical protein PHYBOEH_003160 [Phytophthora boehmeriae]
MLVSYILLVIAATFLANSGAISEEVMSVDDVKVKVASSNALDATQSEVASHRLLRTHKKLDVEEEERGINKAKMLIDEDHKFYIFRKWYGADLSSMWAYDKLKIARGGKYEAYRTLYNQYAAYRRARNS